MASKDRGEGGRSCCRTVVTCLRPSAKELVSGWGMQALLTASNAAVGGPATAAAMATARQWTHMVQPALLLGSLGYTMGTAIGCAVGQVLRSLPAGAVF
jgi:uncharacterized membrane protein